MPRPYAQLKRDNEKRLLEEIKEKRTVFTALPPRCTFEFSLRCNYACKKCRYSLLDQGPHFSAAEYPEWEWETVERMAEEVFPTMRYTESTLLGEPFLSPQFEKLMQLHRQYGVYYRPTTNASLLNDHKIELISGISDWLKCSFDAYTDTMYKRLYLNNNYNLVVKNLKKFSKARSEMDPHPWFRVGLVLMRTNLEYLKEYADFVFQELGVDDFEIMCLNYANEFMVDEFYWDIPDKVNYLIDDLVNHCIKNKYRLRLPFTRMPRKDGTWIDKTSVQRSAEIAATQPKADNSGYEKYSEEVRNGDIFGNKEQLEDGYVWSNDMRVVRITADDGSEIGVCEFFTRPFFKPPSTEFDNQPWIKYESCGSCSVFVFGNLMAQPFSSLYNSPMTQDVRTFLYEKYNKPRDEWMLPCKNCLCVDQIYSYHSNGRTNVGIRVFPGENPYVYPHRDLTRRLMKKGWDFLKRKGVSATVKMTCRFLADYYEGLKAGAKSRTGV